MFKAFKKTIGFFKKVITKTDIFVDYFLFDNFIDMLYKRNPMIREQIDSLPFNNPCVHDLAPLLCECVSDEKFDSITKETYLFKLSYKQFKPIELISDKSNLYNKIKNEC